MRSQLLLSLGIAMMTMAMILILINYNEGKRADQSSQTALKNLEQQMVNSSIDTKSEQMPANSKIDPQPEIIREMPEVEWQGSRYIGILELPTYGLKLPIMSEWSDPLLKVTPCRYSGSIYTDNMIVAGHNYRYHFAVLKNIAIGEKLFFTDVEKNRFSYEVVRIEKLSEEDVVGMLDGEWDLTLFTCTDSGKDRITVRCKRTQE